jgi:hypothetical protein
MGTEGEGRVRRVALLHLLFASFWLTVGSELKHGRHTS